jgi:hypothetical protein
MSSEIGEKIERTPVAGKETIGMGSITYRALVIHQTVWDMNGTTTVAQFGFLVRMIFGCVVNDPA